MNMTPFRKKYATSKVSASLSTTRPAPRRNAAGANEAHRAGFGPAVDGFDHVAFGNMNEVRNAVTAETAGIMVEPVQGEGGFYPAPAELMRGLRALCDEHGIVLIADEVQTGFARTGNLFAMDGYDVSADITTMAKGLAGGLPLAAVTGRADLMDAAAPGGLGGTYGGNPLGIAAANAVLDVIEEEDLCARANELGSRLKQRLESIRERAPEIVDIRGPGFMIAAELNTADGSAPNPEMANAIRAEALSRGLVLLTCGVYGNVIRFLAPITVQDEIFAEAMDILEASIDAIKNSWQATHKKV